jgi:hypothetical protein
VPRAAPAYLFLCLEIHLFLVVRFDSRAHGYAIATETKAMPPYERCHADVEVAITVRSFGRASAVAHDAAVITGNGGAPLTGTVDYGYVIAEQRADEAIEFKAYDYSTNAVQKTVAVKADGSPAP